MPSGPPPKRRGSEIRNRTRQVQPEVLPPCKGPKLSQFKAHQLPVRFIRLLSDSETAAHSHVFEVEIDSEIYALKMFRYYQLEDDELGLSDCEVEDPDLPLQIDPFFAECRAFGRIIENEQNGLLAVPCFGFIYIPASREEELERKFGAYNWNRPDEEYDQIARDRKPFRAIVKKLVSESTTWNFKTAKTILRNVRALNALGIYMLDLRAENIIGGQLADFNTSWTEPHVLFGTRDNDEVASRKEEDLILFDVMMAEQHMRKAPRARPNRIYRAKLRSAANVRAG